MTDRTQFDWPSQSDSTNGTIITPEDNELSTLTHSIVEWKRLKEDNDSRKLQVRESNKKMKALEEIIIRIMKTNNIGALDLKNSGGRVLFKRQKRQGAIPQKNMVKLVGDFMKSPEKAQELMTYLQEHKEVIMKETIQYEHSES
jgi:hypothetical protein